MAPDPRIAVCPGSYDPITNGHLDIISRASGMFDELIVAVVNASVRKSQSLFDAEERIGFIERATGHLGNVRVVAVRQARGRLCARAGSEGDRQGFARDLATSSTSWR